MEYSLTRLPKSEIEIRIAIPFSEFEPHVKRAAALISEQIEIEGFRRGKAPYMQVKAEVGEAAIYERAADLAVRKTYPEVLARLGESGEISPSHPVIGKPEIIITKLASGNPLEYKVRASVLPAVSLPDYKAIARRVRQEKRDQAVSDEEIEKALEWLRESRVSLITVDRPAARGDRVEVDFEIRHGGVKIEDGESKNHPLILGEGRFLPGFEDELAGLEAGGKKEFTLTAPADWQNKAWAGKALDFSTETKLVQERKIPELTDEFAKGMGNFASIDALKESVRQGILTEKTEKETQRIRGAMSAAIVKKATMEVPDILIEAETEKMLAELKTNIDHMGMQWTDYLTHINPVRSQTPEASDDASAHRTSNGVKKTEEALKAEWRGEAGTRVRTALVLREIARQEHIEPSEEEIAKRADAILRQYQSPENAGEDIDPAQLSEYARGILKNEKVFEFLEDVS